MKFSGVTFPTRPAQFGRLIRSRGPDSLAGRWQQNYAEESRYIAQVWFLGWFESRLPLSGTNRPEKLLEDLRGVAQVGRR